MMRKDNHQRNSGFDPAPDFICGVGQCLYEEGKKCEKTTKNSSSC